MSASHNNGGASAPSLSAAPQAVVKPLEWDHEAVNGFACSRGGVLSYTIMLSVNRVYGIPGEHDGAAQFDTTEAAKAAAQADYEARILSALTTPPALTVGVPLQQRVQPWMMACFGPEISADLTISTWTPE